ncbi:unnamed protein product [Leptosia nina]|uniref:Peptidase S1 domain-containing protein n=1 Tax=Leptosia nina TaxID=320188 RepID=A0AAV1K0B5_9NEOP
MLSKSLLLFTLLALADVSSESSATGAGVEIDDKESDTAPYMVILEHSAARARRCSGALVSLRTALSSASCARPDPSRADSSLWALAAALVTSPATVSPATGARRVVRVALAGEGADPDDPALDVALLELDAPFGEGARARPILMATTPGECEAVVDCDAVRLLDDEGARQLRVVSLRRAPALHCAARVPHWVAAGDGQLCLRGETLCESETGGGVLCAGLLCGVLTRTASAGATQRGRRGRCGETHGALAVARRRRFLRCAHTQRLCGRGECKSLCTEIWLDSDEDPTSAGIAVVAVASSTPSFTFLTLFAGHLNVDFNTRTIVTVGSVTHANRLRVGEANSTTVPPSAATRATPSPTRTAASVILYYPRLSADFEPNRADFKAGEYGDNAADYGAQADEMAATRPPTPVAPASPTRSRTPSPIRSEPNAERSALRDDWLDVPAKPHSDNPKKSSKKSKAVITLFEKTTLVVLILVL